MNTSTKAKRVARPALSILASLRSQAASATSKYVTIEVPGYEVRQPFWDRKLFVGHIRRLMATAEEFADLPLRVWLDRDARTHVYDYAKDARGYHIIVPNPPVITIERAALCVAIGPTTYTLAADNGSNWPGATRLFCPEAIQEESSTMTEPKPTTKPAKPAKAPKAAPVVAVDTSPTLATPPPPPPSAVSLRETLATTPQAVREAMTPPKPASGYYTTRSEYRGAPMLCVHDAKGEIVLQFQARKARALAACAAEIAAFASEV